MKQTITVGMSKQVKKKLGKFFRQFRALRNRMMAKALTQGIYTDQDVFKYIQ